MLNFDKHFEAFIKEWYKRREDEGCTPDEMEELLPEAYAEWLGTPDKQLGGVTPTDYMKQIDNPDTLFSMLKESFRTGEGASMLLIDRMGEVDGVGTRIADALLKGEIESEFIVECMNILSEIGGAHPIATYVGYLADETADEGIKELATEILNGHADEAAPLLFPLIEKADETLSEMIAEVLSYAKKDARTSALLKDLFLSGRNTPLAAALIARYGDDALVSLLYPALDNCNYADFIEIRNAIEALGGVVDDGYRDFSDDPYYRLIKGNN